MKRVFIIHGWEASPESNWFPWLKEELEKKRFSVQVPAMPNTMKPTLNSWLKHLQSIIREPDENTYLVGHSLGVITILRYLESLPSEKKVGGIVLVAGFPEPISYDELNNFFITPLDYQKVRSSAGEVVAIHSENDPHVPLKNGEILKEKIGAKLLIVQNAGHLNAEDGFIELSIILESLLEMAEKSII